jgi:hypothetical protein
MNTKKFNKVMDFVAVGALSAALGIGAILLTAKPENQKYQQMSYNQGYSQSSRDVVYSLQSDAVSRFRDVAKEVRINAPTIGDLESESDSYQSFASEALHSTDASTRDSALIGLAYQSTALKIRDREITTQSLPDWRK